MKVRFLKRLLVHFPDDAELYIETPPEMGSAQGPVLSVQLKPAEGAVFPERVVFTLDLQVGLPYV